MTRPKDVASQNSREVDILIIGAGPVGLMCAYLAHLCGLSVAIIDSSTGPIQMGRADALNARTLQLLEIAGLFKDFYPLGKPCNTSSVWANGNFVSRQSSWWDELEGCFHKHFLMLGQAPIEQLLDSRLREASINLRRSTTAVNVELVEDGCITEFSNKDTIRSKFVIGADGSRSLVRKIFGIPFEIERPQIVWAVIDGVIETDFPKVPEIIVFQAETSDVAWIPREGSIDRFYVRMDFKEFTLEEAFNKINRAMQPHSLRFKEITWHSRFSVKESVAERFSIQNKVFLAGDACHIHSVNGGQGLNTGIADAFNLVWKLHQVIRGEASEPLLATYEDERKPVALSVVETSGELVRSTKHSSSGTHAEDYVRIVQKRSGYVTGMGIRYPGQGLSGTRLLDCQVSSSQGDLRLYSLLDYSKHTLFIFGDVESDPAVDLSSSVQIIRIHSDKRDEGYWTPHSPYGNQMVMVRPDSYIQWAVP